MRWQILFGFVVAACVALSTTTVLADAQWTGAGGDDLWTTAANWDPSMPVSATDRHNPTTETNDNNVARNQLNGTNILIEDGIDAVAFSIQIGYPIDGTLGGQAASNSLTMTGGTLTTQGNWLMNVGRSRNADPGQLVQFNVSGGVVNAAGITVPEAFDPDSVLGFTSVGINAEMNVSGDSVVNTDLLRLGSWDSNSTVTISDNARVNLTDDNNGFANGQLWLESFEDLDDTGGTSLLDISDMGVMSIHGGVNNIQDDQTASLALIVDELIPRGMITANGGADPVVVVSMGNVIYLAADAGAIPEPTTVALLLLSCPLMLARRR